MVLVVVIVSDCGGGGVVVVVGGAGRLCVCVCMRVWASECVHTHSSWRLQELCLYWGSVCAVLHVPPSSSPWHVTGAQHTA